jgi:hypothetical protein
MPIKICKTFLHSPVLIFFFLVAEAHQPCLAFDFQQDTYVLGGKGGFTYKKWTAGTDGTDSDLKEFSGQDVTDLRLCSRWNLAIALGPEGIQV